MRGFQYDESKFLPNFNILGTVARFTSYKPKAITDSHVLQWIKDEKIEFNHSYRMCQPTCEDMQPSITKYNKGQPILDDLLWQISGQWTQRHWTPTIAGARFQTLDYCISQAAMTTSAGYPWSRWFTNKGEALKDPRVLSYIQRYALSQGTLNPLTAIWTSSLKRELRPLEKLKKIRTFTASPVEHSLACNVACLDFNERFYASHSRTWSFVGCSPYYRGFHQLYTRLSKHPNAYELDESQFDSSLFRAALEGQRDIRFALLLPALRTDATQLYLKNIYDQIIESVIVLDTGLVVQKSTGNPSGSANTIVDNTMILYRLFAYAWLLLAKENCPEMMSYDAFHSNVEAALNGDDNSFTTSDLVRDWFNPTRIARVWSEIGVTTNSPCMEPRPLSEISFLSSEFKLTRAAPGPFAKEPAVWLPMPERDKVLCSLVYGIKKQISVDIRFTLLRAYALRNTSWACPQLRVDLERFILWVYRNHSKSLTGALSDYPDITMENVQSVYKTDDELWRLYTYNGDSTFKRL